MKGWVRAAFYVAVIVAGILVWLLTAYLQFGFNGSTHAQGLNRCTMSAPCIRYVHDYEVRGAPIVRVCYAYSPHGPIHWFPVKCTRRAHN